MDSLKPGDRALVVGLCREAHLNGLVVTVESGPHVEPYGDVGRKTPTIVYWVDGVPPGPYVADVLAARYLIRIPPDSECKQMFRETSKPKEVQRA